MNVFHEIKGTLHDMRSDTRALSADLRRVTARVDHLDQSLGHLLETFTSVELLFLDHERRIQALEGRLPPAA